MAIANQTSMTLDEFIASLQEAADRMDDLPIASDMQDAITEAMYEGIQKNYDSASTAWGQPWAPHAPYTVRMYGPHPLLILTGRMLAASTSSGVQGNYLSVSDRSIVIGVDLPYAANQQFGTDIIPARPFFDLPENTIRQVEDIAADYLVHELIG